MLIFLSITLSGLLAGCGTDSTEGSAEAARAQVESALAHASAIGVSSITITQLANNKTSIDNQQGWFGINGSQAQMLYNQLLLKIQLAETQSRITNESQARETLGALKVVISQNVSFHYDSPLYQKWTDEFARLLTAGKTPRDFATITTLAQERIITVQSLAATGRELQQFASLILLMENAHLSTPLVHIEYKQDKQVYNDAIAQGDLLRLRDIIRAQKVGILNEQTQAIPLISTTILDSFAQRIELAEQFGEDTTTFHAWLDDDRKILSTINSIGQFMAFQEQIKKQDAMLDVPLIRGHVHRDLEQFHSLIDFCKNRSIVVYEYVGNFGLVYLQEQVNLAKTTADFQIVDAQIIQLSENLRGLIANTNDSTPSDHPHTTDIELMHYYQVIQGKVIIISLREQALRAYENGNLVMWSLVTTGREDRASPPGFWHINERREALTFNSPDSPNSPYWYPPTYINFALQYHDGGFYIHDAWWRKAFGPGTNQLHEDPQGYNNGSHGCVNLPLDQMGPLYHWTSLETPVIVY
jgi:hypothetical protein